jgi:hypothetical protein
MNLLALLQSSKHQRRTTDKRKEERVRGRKAEESENNFNDILYKVFGRLLLHSQLPKKIP